MLTFSVSVGLFSIKIDPLLFCLITLYGPALGIVNFLNIPGFFNVIKSFGLY